jgi:hypothetical protein
MTVVFSAAEIVPYTKGLHPSGIFPLEARYARENKRLSFVAARHVADVGSTTHALIEQVFARLKPQAAVLEGFAPSGANTWNQEMRAFYLEKAQKRSAETPDHLPENQYALLRAAEGGAEIFSGDPSDLVQAHNIVAQGYTKDDYFYFDFLLSVDHWEKRKLPDNALPGMWRWHADHAGYLGMAAIPSFADFKRWFLRVGGSEFALSKMDGQFIAPEAGAVFGTLGHMGSVLSRFRDGHLLSTLEKALNQYDRVVAVYGGSHFFTLKPALDKVMTPVDDWHNCSN